MSTPLNFKLGTKTPTDPKEGTIYLKQNIASGNGTKDFCLYYGQTNSSLLPLASERLKTNYSVRKVEESPKDIPPGLTFSFKEGDWDNFPIEEGNYHGVINLKKWHDSTGGKIAQIAYSEQDNLLLRTGEWASDEKNNWNSWKKILDTQNFGNIINNGVVIHPTATIDSGSNSGSIAIGDNACSHYGIAIGKNTRVESGGVSLGVNAYANYDGNAIGYNAYSGAGGGAVGSNAEATCGFAGGDSTKTSYGGSIGYCAFSTDGGAVGRNAKTISGTCIGPYTISNNSVEIITHDFSPGQRFDDYYWTILLEDGAIIPKTYYELSTEEKSIVAENGLELTIKINFSARYDSGTKIKLYYNATGNGFAGGYNASAENGGAMGQNASSTSGGAMGWKANTKTGGAVGYLAASIYGGAVGYMACTTEDGGSVGRNASSTNGGAIGSSAYSTEGGAVGYYAFSTIGGAIGRSAYSTNGGSVGSWASSTEGGAVGRHASSTLGGAIGSSAYSTTGFAGGYSAKATADGAVQLGEGTNEVANTLNFRDYQLMDANGYFIANNYGTSDPSGTATVGSIYYKIIS